MEKDIMTYLLNDMIKNTKNLKVSLNYHYIKEIDK